MSNSSLPRTYSVGELTETIKNEPVTPTYSTGWSDFDQITKGGIAEGEVVLCSAEGGAGKTHFAVNLSINFAKQGYKVLYLPLEDGWKQINRRFIEMDADGRSSEFVRMVMEEDFTLENAKQILSAASRSYNLIILDNLFAMPLRNGATNDYWANQAEWVDDICSIVRSRDCGMLILHHLNKTKEKGVSSYQIAGSTRLRNRVGQSWLMARSENAPDVTSIKIDKHRRSKTKGQIYFKSDATGLLYVQKDMRVDRQAVQYAKEVFELD